MRAAGAAADEGRVRRGAIDAPRLPFDFDFPEDHERAARDARPLVEAAAAPVPSAVAPPRLATGVTGG